MCQNPFGTHKKSLTSIEQQRNSELLLEHEFMEQIVGAQYISQAILWSLWIKLSCISCKNALVELRAGMHTVRHAHWNTAVFSRHRNALNKEQEQ